MTLNLNIKEGYLKLLNQLLTKVNDDEFNDLYNLPEEEICRRLDNLVNMIRVERSREIVKHRYGLSGYETKTCVELAKRYSVCKEYISNLSRQTVNEISTENNLYCIILKDIPIHDDIANLSDNDKLARLGLSTKTYNALLKEKINNIGDLKDACQDLRKLKQIRSLGNTGIQEIYNKMNLTSLLEKQIHEIKIENQFQKDKNRIEIHLGYIRKSAKVIKEVGLTDSQIETLIKFALDNKTQDIEKFIDSIL